MRSTPRFAITGHPNKGKSSIVATLAEDENVGISEIPGTTSQAQVYPMRMDGETLYELIDTPGFQRAREVLEWLKNCETSVVDRHQAVLKFLDCFSNDPHFHDECELLKPIMRGAGILYVVDGARPYGTEYECEMQVLQWTGQPRMALINLIGGEAHVEDWRRALDQYFSIVRVFDAQHADFSKRIDLLRAFEALEESWSASIQLAIDVLQQNRTQRLHRAAREIAELLLAVLCMQKTATMDNKTTDPVLEARLVDALKDAVRKREEQTCTTLAQLCGHSRLERNIEQAAVVKEDLFSRRSFSLFGLSNTQLALTGAASGAIAGGGLDLLVGGASLFLGSGVGALLGGAGVLLGARQLAEVNVLGNSLGGYKLIIGPVSDKNFPWVVLGRVVLFYRLISERNHARRDTLIVSSESANSFAESMNLKQRQGLNDIFKRIREHQTIDTKTLTLLVRQIENLCR